MNGADTTGGNFADRTRLYFLFDFISHNAYLAWARAIDIAARHGLHFEPVPVVFGAMLSAHGQIGPAEIPPKSRWMLRDVLRKAAVLNLPIAPPHSHPFKSLVPLRWACCALEPAARLRLIDALWRATWAESLEVSDPAVVADVVRRAGFDADALAQEVEGEAVKQRLRANTHAALAAGAFGVPTCFVRGTEQMFWGYDDLTFLELALSGSDPLGASPDLSAWMQVRASVQRRR
ncbi:MAG: 2-hydroxychromene-2-carboxylate isomerase [Panacagrimonas sp.]